MDTFEDLQVAVNSDFSIGTESTLFPPATVKLAINRAYRRAGGLFRWPETEDAKTTSTEADQEYYDYPQNWRPDSVWKLTVGGTDYGDPLVFKDYLYEKENDIPSGEDYLWANHHRKYFIYPTPTTNGSNNISIWGQEVVDELVNDEDTTIFSYSLPECNEAIVLEAVAILKNKGEEPKTGEMISLQAKQILAVAFGKIRQEQSKYEKTQPFFDVPDYFSGQSKVEDIIGNF